MNAVWFELSMSPALLCYFPDLPTTISDISFFAVPLCLVCDISFFAVPLCLVCVKKQLGREGQVAAQPSEGEASVVYVPRWLHPLEACRPHADASEYAREGAAAIAALSQESEAAGFGALTCPMGVRQGLWLMSLATSARMRSLQSSATSTAAFLFPPARSFCCLQLPGSCHGSCVLVFLGSWPKIF